GSRRQAEGYPARFGPGGCSAGRGSAGVAAAVQLVALQVVPVAVEADLDHVPGELLVGGVEALELGRRGDAAAVGPSQGVAVDVGDEAKARVPADRGLPGGGLAD